MKKHLHSKRLIFCKNVQKISRKCNSYLITMYLKSDKNKTLLITKNYGIRDV